MILSAVAIAAVVAALVFSRRPVPGDGGTRRKWAGSPVIALVFVTCAIYLNQVLFTVYVLRVPVAAAALLGLAAARWTAGFTSGGPPGSGIESIARSFGWLLAIFAVPAPPVRYGLGFGAAYISVAAALVLIAVAAAHGIRETFSHVPGQLTTWLLQMAATLIAATFAGAAALLLPGRYVETRLLWSAAAFFVCAISVCASIDRFRAGRHVKAEYRR